MKLNYKYTIIYTLICLFIFWLIIKYGTKILDKQCFKKGLTLKEGLTDFEKYSQKIIPYPKDAVINYNDINSPLYSRTVNLPINDPVSCKNFCGPQAQCSITREQCSSDIDCKGCNPGPKIQSECITKDVEPYDATGKLGYNQGLNYSSLTTGYNGHNANFSEVYPGSKDVQIIKPYLGLDLWTKSFNKGMELYNKKRESLEKYSEGVSNAIPIALNNPTISNNNLTNFTPKYPLSYSVTGQFYETTPPASNESI
jgi:hypothetical protein